MKYNEDDNKLEFVKEIYNMKKVCLAVLPALTIVLELLPFGAVCIFATSPTERVKETFSYFSLTPFGYANFAPLITATLTAVSYTHLDVYKRQAEDGLGDTVKPRLIEAGADLDRVLVIDDSDVQLTLSDERIEKAIIENLSLIHI